MAEKTKLGLQESLQREFCPPLDTTLLAALVADIEIEGPPTNQQIDELRFTLGLLAAQADLQADEDEHHLNDAFADVQITDGSTISSSGLGETTSLATSTWSATTSPTSGSPKSRSKSSSIASFSSPLGFLQAAFPHVPSQRLENALAEVGYSPQDEEEVDIVGVIEGLLTKEYLRDLEERGLDALEDEEAGPTSPIPMRAEQAGWEVADKKPKKKKGKGRTIALNDVRQQHHVRSTAKRDAGRPPLPDLWTQVSSLSSHLTSFIPSHPASFFQSFFHSPNYTTPASAVRSALQSIAGPAYEDLSPDDAVLLFNISDLLRCSSAFDELDGEARDRLFADAPLCLAACRSQPDDALDLIWLLRELDADSASQWEIGPYHNPVPSSIVTSPIEISSKYTQKLPSGPPSYNKYLPQRKAQAVPVCSPPPQPQNAWNMVPLKPPPSGPHPLAASIPAYNPLNGVSKKAKAKAAAGDVGQLRLGLREAGLMAGVDGKEFVKQKRRMEELRGRRAEAIISAGRAWQNGNAKNHGGEVAMFYAEQARELQEQARKEAMEAARGMIESKRVTSAFGTTIDLHGTTVSEAVAIAREVLAEYGASPAQPLKIITGRGNHSFGGVAVLGPAVKAALLADGWNVSTYDAGLRSGMPRGHIASMHVIDASDFRRVSVACSVDHNILHGPQRHVLPAPVFSPTSGIQELYVKYTTSTPVKSSTYVMDDSDHEDEFSDDPYINKRKHNTKLRASSHKRRKGTMKQVIKTEDEQAPSLQALLDAQAALFASETSGEPGFEGIFETLVEDLLKVRDAYEKKAERDDFGRPIELLSPSDTASVMTRLEERRAQHGHLSTTEAIVLRKLKVQELRRIHNFTCPALRQTTPAVLTAIPPAPPSPQPNPAVLDALYAIKTTPYESSFLSRLWDLGSSSHASNTVAIGWESDAPWLELMHDVRMHYAIKFPANELPSETRAPITYTTLTAEHLPQIHDLLHRLFWTGIDVSDSLQYGPRQATIVATSKRLVVGCAFLSSPQETYITYLAVRPGWDNAQIATSMLYHLITRNPNKDITLHVSANNPAMLLYNRFGFKAEEFIVGFYEDYLDPQNRASKNAFRLRLRR
ncbi:hypothetical protein EWM64_g373 [Hericium alpestre]|uniref:Smr domain-containing protein n=1 Tax=Hericium alpestre TaxID=135208 RepID=A0A4Z0AC63_9AGAM|nr:hypothetical protein EWM64_g373 [Hericium alpestre]